MSEAYVMSNLYFRSMSLFLRVREKFSHPREQLVASGLGPGQTVLDFGCGVGSYTIPAARLVGEGGQVHALDIHPLAIETVERRAKKEKLANVKTIRSDRATGLPDESVNAVLLYDVFHMVPDRGALLRELHRILKPDGVLSVLPHHMTTAEFLTAMQEGNLFSTPVQHGAAFDFRKNGSGRS